jgi:hypothetical protein
MTGGSLCARSGAVSVVSTGVAHPRIIKKITPASSGRKLIEYYTTSDLTAQRGARLRFQKRAVVSLVLCCCDTQGIVSPGLAAALCQAIGTRERSMQTPRIECKQKNPLRGHAREVG